MLAESHKENGNGLRAKEIKLGLTNLIKRTKIKIKKLIIKYKKS